MEAPPEEADPSSGLLTIGHPQSLPVFLSPASQHVELEAHRVTSGKKSGKGTNLLSSREAISALTGHEEVV
jgi:hypothetical protein